MTVKDIQYITDADGQDVGVIVPIELWREIASERETAYLLKNDAMKKRLLDARDRTMGTTLEEAGIEICEETGLPVFRVPPDAPEITTEFVKELEEDW